MLIYRILSVALFPILELYLLFRVYKKKENQHRLRERFGQATIARPDAHLLWMHAVSVGETNSALILVEEILSTFPETVILFTTTTLTSAAVVEKQKANFGGRLLHQFLPIDSYYCVKSFFNFWQPEVAILVESEIWPNLIDVANQMEIPLFLVNARMSQKSAAKWSWAKFFGFNVFENFSAIFAQSKEDEKRLRQLTKQEVFYFGNLKSQAQNLESNSDELAKLKAQIGSRKFWLAASTHKGEEETVIKTHLELKKIFPDLLTIIVPRHPHRAEEITALLGNLKFAQRSKNHDIVSTTEIYLADTLGELGTFYRLSDFAFLGGSMLEIGGHNPFEAIKLECAVISGVGVFNFREVYSDLLKQDACVMIDTPEKLVQAVQNFLQDQQKLKTTIQNATAAIATSNNIAERIVDQMQEILEK